MVFLIKNIIMLQGIWKPQKIANPDYFEDKEPFKMTSIVSIKHNRLHVYRWDV